MAKRDQGDKILARLTRMELMVTERAKAFERSIKPALETEARRKAAALVKKDGDPSRLGEGLLRLPSVDDAFKWESDPGRGGRLVMSQWARTASGNMFDVSEAQRNKWARYNFARWGAKAR